MLDPELAGRRHAPTVPSGRWGSEDARVAQGLAGAFHADGTPCLPSAGDRAVDVQRVVIEEQDAMRRDVDARRDAIEDLTVGFHATELERQERQLEAAEQRPALPV